MRSLLLALLVAALTACTGPCSELGNRLCECAPLGTTADTCRRQVDAELSKQKPTDSQCSAWLDTCNAPDGVQLCEFIQSTTGKEACGIAYPATP
jgi:hypothetical protein